MRLDSLQQIACRLHGVILTCRMDGQKVFRPFRFDGPVVATAAAKRILETPARPSTQHRWREAGASGANS